jgi:hypothetical protein
MFNFSNARQGIIEEKLNVREKIRKLEETIYQEKNKIKQRLAESLKKQRK